MTIWNRMTNAVATAVRGGTLADIIGQMTEQALQPGGPQTDVRFTIALIALCAKMARSDGAVTVDEVEAFKRIVHVPPAEEANVRRVFDLAKQDVLGFEAYARQIGKLLAGEPQLLRDVVEALCVIAAADGVLHEKEDEFLKTAAEYLGVRDSEMRYIRSLFVRDAASPYEVLELLPSASNAAIKARHRKLVIAHHPDKLIGRGVPAEFVRVAEKRLAAINAAYDTVARERGL